MSKRTIMLDILERDGSWFVQAKVDDKPCGDEMGPYPSRREAREDTKGIPDSIRAMLDDGNALEKKGDQTPMAKKPTKASKAPAPSRPASKPKTTETKGGKRKGSATSRPGKRAPHDAKTGKSDKKLSQLDAALNVLKAARKPLGCKEMVAKMQERGLWTSPGGKTPHATLYSAIIREITKKGDKSRFKKVDKGTFQAA